MKRTVLFVLKQTIKSFYPHEYVTLFYHGTAILHFYEGGKIEIEILDIAGTRPNGFGGFELPSFEDQKTATGEMGAFLSMCRREAEYCARIAGLLDTTNVDVKTGKSKIGQAFHQYKS